MTLTQNPVKIMLVDDHAVLRDALRPRLGVEPDLRVVAEAPDAGIAVELAPAAKPDVLVMDIDMPGPNCFDAVRQIQQLVPEVRILFLSALQTDQLLSQALAVRARGYLTKGEPADRLVEAIRTVAQGGVAFSDQVWARLVVDADASIRLAESRPPAPHLTQREVEVLRLLAQGLARREIAQTAGISPKTAARHIENIMSKTGIHDRVGLAQYAIRQGLAKA